MRKNIFLTATAAALLSVALPPAGALRSGGPGVASAQDDDPEVTRMAKEHYKLGLDNYKAGKYDVAIKELKKAYLLKRLPPILINIALTYRKSKDFDMATYFYKKFLTEAPADDKQRPAAQSALAEIEQEKAAAQAPAPEPARPAVEVAGPKPAAPVAQADQPKARTASRRPIRGGPPIPPLVSPTGSVATPAAPVDAAPVAAAAPAVSAVPAAQHVAAASEWSHTPIDAVPPNSPIDVAVQMPVMKGVKVKVFYRKEGQSGFDSMELKRRGNEKVARLPDALSSGRTFQYYIEARDAAGTLVKSSGSEASPNIVLVDKSARQQVAGAQGDGQGGTDEDSGKTANGADGEKTGYSRDIENESASFDIDRKARQDAAAQLRDTPGKEKSGRHYPIGTMGWVGGGVAAVGVVALAGSFTALGLAAGRANAVSADSTCQNKVDGECPHFGPNPTPGMTLSLPSPTSADYQSQGLLDNKIGIGLLAAGLVATVGGGSLLAYDFFSRRAKDRASAAPPVKKKRKVRKVIEVEETTLRLAPVLGPGVAGLLGEVRF